MIRRSLEDATESGRQCEMNNYDEALTFPSLGVWPLFRSDATALGERARRSAKSVCKGKPPIRVKSRCLEYIYGVIYPSDCRRVKRRVNLTRTSSVADDCVI